MTPEFRERGPQIDRERVTRIEGEFGRKFPDVYVRFLLSTNGSRPYPTVVRVANHAEELFSVNNFFGIAHSETTWDLIWSLNTYKDLFEDGMVVVAKTGTGDTFVMDARTSEGEMYFADYAGRPDAAMTAISVGFEEFLQGFLPESTLEL